MGVVERIENIAVFCGSRSNVRPSFRHGAKALGAILAQENIRLVYGGGAVGMMGIIADSVLENGGKVLGVIPEFLDTFEIGHQGVTELVITGSMHERKQMMADKSQAFIVMPGGLGTLDETFEILTWKQLQLHSKPVIICNLEGYWTPLLAIIKHQIRENFAKPDDENLFQVVTDVAAILPALRSQQDKLVGNLNKWQDDD